MRRRTLKPDEQDLWRRFTKSVTPLDRRAPAKEPGPMAPARAATAPPKSPGPALRSGAAPALASPRNVAPTHQLDGTTQRQLRRGRAQIDAKIDLHGMRQAEAHTALNSFMSRAQGRGYRCVLVITGKGTRGEPHTNPYETPGPGILRTRLRQWLAQDPLRGMVFGVEEAHPRHGGAGAFYVFIRKTS